ncbi:MAG: ATP-binding cassette domain-containing protein [Erysipelothrix sp.]|nr:ATP-binding cassette domain-containing protein [Erysipelothrix sp.]
MRHIGIVINDLQRFGVSISKIREIYYANSKIVKNEYVMDPIRVDGDIVFDDVSFTYDHKEMVLSNINLHIKPNETVAIMGSVGSGKTTLINLLARMYDVTSGEILIDGVNIKDYKLDELRANIAIATQRVMLFSDTIYNNIGYGMKELDESVIVQSAKDAIAHNFILNTYDGYNTLIGEEGVGLSGGQKQRLALARALASNRPILILDDTTSAVDNETEMEITKTLIKNKDHMTQIIITQRVTTSMYADKIIVLEDGKIIQEGTHSSLLKEDGYYRDTARLQELGGEI